MTRNSASDYPLGSTEAEHERLIRQAARLASSTERLFREAGIGPGQRVLDVGSGVGDVAMLAARLVGPSGEVVGIERDERSIARARARIDEAVLQNISLFHAEAGEASVDEVFDAAVGRFILQFVPDPISVLASVSRLVRPGGVIAFQEVVYAPFFLLAGHLPLCSKAVSLVRRALRDSGTNTEMGLALYRTFLKAGLPGPTMRMEIPMGTDPRWIYDLLCALRPNIPSADIDKLGHLSALLDKLRAEVAASNSVLPYSAFVGAWSRKPTV